MDVYEKNNTIAFGDFVVSDRADLCYKGMIDFLRKFGYETRAIKKVKSVIILIKLQPRKLSIL